MINPEQFPEAEAVFAKLVAQFAHDLAAIQKLKFKIAVTEHALHGVLIPTRVVWLLPREQEEIAFAA